MDRSSEQGQVASADTGRSHIDAFQLRAAKTRAAKIRARRVGPRKIGAGKIRVVEFCKFQIGARKVGARKIGLAHIRRTKNHMHQAHGLVFHVGRTIGAGKIRTDEARAGHVAGDARLRQSCAIHFRTQQLRAEQMRAFEIGGRKIGLQRPGLIEQGAAQIGARKFRVVEAGATQVCASEIEFREVQPVQAFVGQVEFSARRTFGDQRLYVGARKFGLGEGGRGEIDTAHHALREGRADGQKLERHDGARDRG